METTILILNHSSIVDSELIVRVVKSGLKIVTHSDISLFEEEGQVVFNIMNPPYDLVLHVGSKAYYIDVNVKWGSLELLSEIGNILSDCIFPLMSILGFQQTIGIMGDGQLSLAYDKICDGFSLDDITNLEEVKTEVNYCSIEYMDDHKLNLISIDATIG